MTMNRRNFITGSALVGLGTLLLPKGVKAKPKDYEPAQTYRPALSVKDGIEYMIMIYHAGVNNFSKATAAEKKIELNLYKYANSAVISMETIYYSIKKVNEVKGSYNTWKVKADIEGSLHSETLVDKNFRKTISFEIKLLDYIKIYDKKDKLFDTLKWYTKKTTTYDDDFEGCFLTTACVENKGLADNCDELSTLRLLRDNYMKNTEEGIDLINKYNVLGPEIVSTINSFENKKEIYDFIFEHMIQPSVTLVKKGNLEDAVSFYKESVKKLKEAYL